MIPIEKLQVAMFFISVAIAIISLASNVINLVVKGYTLFDLAVDSIVVLNVTTPKSHAFPVSMEKGQGKDNRE